MTAARDERATARQARRVGRNRLAAAAEDLDRSPAVLRVPGPWITDPAWQAEAQRLDGVRADAIADRSGLLGLEADLDDLDARPPGDAVASQALRVWLDGLASPGELLAGLVPDPRRRFLGAAPAMTEATAAAILRARAEQGGSVGDLDDLTSRAGLTDDDVFDLSLIHI